jgi:hypothetical protein
MDSQIISLWFYSFYLHPRRIMNPSFHPPSVFPSVNLSSFHLPHTETHRWGPHPSSVFQEISALHGALISHWGTCFCICTFSPNYSLFIVQTPLFSVISFCRHRWRLDSFFVHTQPMSPLVGALLLIYSCQHHPYLQSTTLVTYLYPLNLFTLSRLWHNLSLVLSSPRHSTLSHGCGHALYHTPSNQGQS